MDLTGASAVVTGGASGLGEASARKLAELGARCVIVDLQDEKGEAVAKELGGLYVKADVADEEQVQAAVESAGGDDPRARAAGEADPRAGRERALARGGELQERLRNPEAHTPAGDSQWPALCSPQAAHAAGGRRRRR